MENKIIYLTSIAFKNCLGKKLQPNSLAETINSELNGAIFIDNTDKNIIKYEDYMTPVSRHKNETPDIIFSTLKLYGNFISEEELTDELMIAKGLDSNEAKTELRAILANKRQFFSVNKKWGINDFILNTESQNSDDIIYRNYIDKDELGFMEEYFAAADFDDENYAEVICDILKKSKKEKISLKTALYYIWLADKKLFDNTYILEDIDKSKVLVLMGGYLFCQKTLDSYMAEIIEDSKKLDKVEDAVIEEKQESQPEVSDEEIDITLPDSVIEKVIGEINSKDCVTLSSLISEYYSDEYYDPMPKDTKEAVILEYLKEAFNDSRIEFNGKAWFSKVNFEPEDRTDIIEMIKEKETLDSEYIIKEILGVGKKHPKFNDLSKEIEKMLSDANEISYLGNFTWGLPVELPSEVSEIPDILKISKIYPTENAEGDVFDQEIAVDGFEGTLRTDIYNSLCEDVFDEDSSKTLYSIMNGKQKCVLKYHHKIAGTFPLCQIPPDFFGQKTSVFPIVVFTDSGIRETVYVNNDTRLLVGMAPFYEDITDVSGRIFYLEKTEAGNEFRFVLGDTEKSCNIDINRSMELIEIKSRLENENLTLFDIICEILEKKPIDFMQLLTEVNIVKRVSRLMIASTLSSYHCFNHNKKN
ncbi:MAG: hypothetical protein KBT47_09415 [Armatimonadetes bacterium]|nr:hypothetical protein [Candidatus Hippobium faecium]